MADLDIIDGSSLHLLPGDACPGLLCNWTGPLLGRPGVVACIDGSPLGRCDMGEPGLWTGDDFADLRLDLHRPECIDRVIRVLWAGVPCACKRAYTGPVTDAYIDAPDGAVLPGAERVGDRWEPRPCSDCTGTGHLIAPADLSWARDLPAWQAGAILAASVLRVVAGERPIRTPLVRVRSGWGFAGNPTPLWLDAGQPLAASHALDNTDHILIPLTGGKVARVEVPDA